MEVEKILLEATKYGGNSESGQKSISASSLVDDPLRLWLRWKHGVPPSDTVTQATIGSLVHLGMEKIIETLEPVVPLTKHLESEVEVGCKMDKGWSFSGTIDILDHETKTIYDVKVVKKYRIEKLRKEEPDDPYIWQLNAYRYMLCRLGVNYRNMKVIGLSCDAGFDFRSGKMTNVLNIVDVPLIEDAYIEDRFNEQAKILNDHIAMDTPPEKCKDTWPRKVNGKTIPVRCVAYCDYSSLCPHFNPKRETVLAAFGC